MCPSAQTNSETVTSERTLEYDPDLEAWKVTPHSYLDSYALSNFDAAAERSSNSSMMNRYLPDKCYISISKKSFGEEPSRRMILQHFSMPPFLATDTCTELNGYFGSQSEYDEKDKLKAHSSWFRCLVKIYNPGKSEDGKAYYWREMGFFIRWTSSGILRILGVDTPDKILEGLQASMLDNRISISDILADPFAIFAPLLDEIVKLYDNSVWLVRHPVREIEQNRTGHPQFEQMHEMSRHAIHVSEVLAASIQTFESLERRQSEFYAENGFELTKTLKSQRREYMAFQKQQLQSLLLRSRSNHERLKNEITVAYNLLTQQDNNVMKSIALLTMIFLPATFVSAIFSTTFFDFSEGEWKMADEIWIYWLTTMILTALTVLVWYIWLNGPKEIVKRLQLFLKRILKRNKSQNDNV